ncbi:MAG: acyloxyacyl hydrolase [Balneolaceae bacterium]
MKYALSFITLFFFFSQIGFPKTQSDIDHIDSTSVSRASDSVAPGEPELTDDLWIGLWLAYSPYSTPLIARMRNAQLGLVGVNVRYASLNLGKRKLRISSELILLGWADYPKNGVSGPRTNRLAAGILPLRLTVPLTKDTGDNYFFVDMGAGVVFFDQPYPNDEGTLLNATVDLGIGYNFRLTETTKLRLGYRFHHISNGGGGVINPGIDSGLIVLSIHSRS